MPVVVCPCRRSEMPNLSRAIGTFRTPRDITGAWVGALSSRWWCWFSHRVEAEPTALFHLVLPDRHQQIRPTPEGAIQGMQQARFFTEAHRPTSPCRASRAPDRAPRLTSTRTSLGFDQPWSIFLAASSATYRSSVRRCAIRRRTTPRHKPPSTLDLNLPEPTTGSRCRTKAVSGVSPTADGLRSEGAARAPRHRRSTRPAAGSAHIQVDCAPRWNPPSARVR